MRRLTTAAEVDRRTTTIKVAAVPLTTKTTVKVAAADITMWVASSDNGADAPVLRCHAGHAYSVAHFLLAQREEIEASLWAAVRALQERGALLEKMAQDSQKSGRSWAAESFSQHADEVTQHADRARQFLLELGNLGEDS